MIRLIYNYYEDKHPARKAEIDFCLKNNLANSLLNVVILEMPGRPKYQDAFNIINKLTSPDDINILCNSDIFFDDTIALTSRLKEHECWVLSRWDWRNDKVVDFFNRQDSQDTWIFRGKVREVKSDFYLGTPGCDNKIAYELQQAGYSVSNPSQTVKSYHVHNSAIRSYTRQDAVPAPYLVVPTSKLNV